MSKFYAVWVGRKPGIYTNWDECKAQVDKFPNPKYRKLVATTMKEAELEYANDASIPSYTANSSSSKSSNNPIGTPIENILTVDGAWNGKVCEYQAVWFPSKEKAFKSKVYDGGTNNIAEFLAIIDALKFLTEKKLPLQIYSDSVTAMAWFKNKSANTTARTTGKITKELDTLLTEAEDYLKTNSELMKTVKLLKWETKTWGEIPADFDRK